MNKNTKVSEIFRESLTVYQKRFWTFFLIVLIPLLFTRLISYFFSTDFKLVDRLITFIITTWETLALYQTIQNKNTNLLKIFSQSLKKLFPFLIVNLFFYLAVFGGSILFIVPGILFMIWFNLAFWIFVDQNIGGNQALMLSKEYMKGNIGYFLKKNILIILISIIPALTIFYLLRGNLILSWTVTSIISALIAPLTAIYGHFIYQNIKDSKISKSKK